MSLLLARAVILLGALAVPQEPLGEAVPVGSPEPTEPAPSSELAPGALQAGDVQIDAAQIDAAQLGEAQAGQAPLGELAPVEDPLARARRLESLYQGALVGVVDGEDFAETPGYRQLLESLSHYGDDELRQKAGRFLDVPGALAEPDAWRGEIVRVHALIVGQNAVRFARPLGEHVDVFRAYLSEADGTEGIVVDFLEPPPTLDIQDDVVALEAVFFRTVRYENKKGAFVDAPYLIARGIRRMDTTAVPRSTTFDGMAKILLGAAVAFLVVRIVLSMRKSKAPDRTAAMAARALRERARLPLQPRPPAHKP